MYKSEYLNKLMNDVKTNYENEPEFINAVEEFFDSMDYIVETDKNIEKLGILERLVVPERVFQFRVPWVDDNGKVHVNTGYRVQFNSAIGPYKGGMRFHPSVNLSILKFLAFEQTFKNSLTGLPMGGGKGGADFDPRGKSDGEIMRFCQSFMAELYPFLGPDTDVPAGDLGFGAREVGYMYGMYKKLKHENTGMFTGKGLSYGGSKGRTEATGYGLLYFVKEMLQCFKGETLEGKKVIVSGSGKVAKYAALKAKEFGATVVAMSDINGWISDPNGLDVDFIKEVSELNGECTKPYVEKYPNVLHGDNTHDIWKVPCDIALPCATQNEINLDDAKALKANGCYMLVEGANMPTALNAIHYLEENGVLFAPGKASNAGGVAVSGLEMSQNAMHLSWTYEEVDEKLQGIMKNIFKMCYETAAKYGQPTNISLGANIAGFLKVYDAMKLQGIV